MSVYSAKHQKKAKKKAVAVGVIHIRLTYSNIIVNVTDPQGNKLFQYSGGMAGFKGSTKPTPYAGQTVGAYVVKTAMGEYGMKAATASIRGLGGAAGQAAMIAIQRGGLNIMMIKDNTPVPHNGCRLRKKRRT